MSNEPDKSRDRSPKVAGGQTPDSGKPMAAYGLLGAGFELLVAVGALGALGWYLDSRFNLLPWLTIAGAAVGFAAGLTMIVRSGRQAFKD